MSGRSKFRHFMPIVPALLLGWALRINGLGSTPFWYDDIIIVEPARLAPGPMLEVVRQFWGTSPLEYLLTGLALPLMGEHELTLRAPEAWFSLLAMALAGRIARQHFGHRAGLATIWILATAIWPIRYAQEVRSYGWYALSFWLIWQAGGRALARNRLRDWGLLVLASVVGSHVNYLALLGLVRLPLEWLLLRRSARQIAASIGAGMAILIALVPWLTFANPLSIGADASLQRQAVTMLGSLPYALAGLGWVGNMYQTESGVVLVMVSVLPWIYLGTVGVLRALRGAPAQRMLPLTLAAAVLVLLAGAVITRYSFFSGRNFLPLNLLWGMLAAFGLSRMAVDARARGGWVFWGGLVLVGLAAIPQLAEHYRWEKTSAPEVARQLPADAQRIAVFGAQPAQEIAATEIRYYFERTHPGRMLQTVEVRAPVPVEAARSESVQWMAGPSLGLPHADDGPLTPAGWRVVIPPQDVLGHIALFTNP